MLQFKFKEISLNSFWVTLHNEFLRLLKKAVEMFLQFQHPGYVEHGYCALTNIKTKNTDDL